MIDPISKTHLTSFLEHEKGMNVPLVVTGMEEGDEDEEEENPQEGGGEQRFDCFEPIDMIPELLIHEHIHCVTPLSRSYADHPFKLINFQKK